MGQITIFMLIIIVILLAIKFAFLDEIKEIIPSYWEIADLISLVTNAIFFTFVFLASYLFGMSAIKYGLLYPLREHEIQKKNDYIYIPFPVDVKEGERDRVYSFEYYHCRFIVTFPLKKLSKRKNIKQNIIIVLIVFAIVIIKGCLSMSNFGDSFATILLEVFLLGVVLICGSGIGNDMFERKFTCNWNSLRPEIIGNYFFHPISSGNINTSCIFVCPLARMHQFSIKDAEEVYRNSLNKCV